MKIDKQDLKRILIYIGITFGLTWVYCLFVVYPIANGEALNGIPALATQLAVAATMFFPAVGVLLTRLITKEGFQNAWLRPHIKGNFKHYLLAWFGPGILTFAGMGIYFLLFPGTFDPDCGYMKQAMAAAGMPYEAQAVPMNMLMAIQVVQAFLLAPILNFVTCFGEEWGWRGYLLPKVSKHFSAVPTLLITGIIWGLWHAPLTVIGHNYGLGYWGFPFTGIAMMCLFCITLGIFLSFVTLKTGSCIPAILGHGAVNGIAAIGIYFTHDGGNPFVGPAPTGIIGMIPFIAVAVFMVLQLKKPDAQEGKAKDSNKKKMIAPIVVTILMVLYYIAYFGFLITLVSGIWKYALGIIPLVFSAVMVKVCIERIHEIKKGEENDLSKY